MVKAISPALSSNKLSTNYLQQQIFWGFKIAQDGVKIGRLRNVKIE
jgi:hypothetical protein